MGNRIVTRACRRAPLGVALAVAALGAPALAQAAPNQPVPDPNFKVGQATSSNWSGYSTVNGRFTSVSASWVQPTATCTSASTWSSFWVGIDGNGSNTVEQTGSSADCSGGRPSYYAWYEMYPKYPVNLGLAVRPGDILHGSVTASGSGRFVLSLRNTSTGQSFSTTKRLSRAQLASAEVIAEAPSSSQGVLPLTNFGTVNFSASTVNGQSIGSFNPERITMVTRNGTVKAQPSALSGGTSFSVAWHHS